MAKTLTGGRGKVYIDNALVGIFDSCSWSGGMAVEPIYILGRASAAEIVPTAFETVNVSCSGFRVVDNGIHTLPKFPKFQDFLNLQGIKIDIVDRQTGKMIASITDCVPTSHNQGVNARATSRISINFMGIKLTDESGDQAEVDPVNLP
jgi:hypothetical protein